ncbi:hypothetical protein [Pedococcus bigeumensis]|uniref:hypothetical protein n=1 Tax=Pedococcus bigeumensis TaxID=433644 RepID=UPI002FEDA6C8
MRVEEQSSLNLLVAGERLHLIVGAAHRDGTLSCHLLSETPRAAGYFIRLDLTGHIRDLRALDSGTAPPSGVRGALDDVGPAVWRAGLADGLRRRLEVLARLDMGGGPGVDDLARLVARTRAKVAALESDDTVLQPVLARLASTWTGTVEELGAAAEQELNR